MGILRRNKSSADIEHRIRDAIAAMRPLLRNQELNVELLAFDGASGVATLRLEGDCPDCDLNVGALRTGIEAHLRLRVPEIAEVRTTTTGEKTRDG